MREIAALPIGPWSSRRVIVKSTGDPAAAVSLAETPARNSELRTLSPCGVLPRPVSVQTSKLIGRASAGNPFDGKRGGPLT